MLYPVDNFVWLPVKTASYTMVTGFFTRGKSGRGVALATQPHLTRLLPLHFMACSRVNVTCTRKEVEKGSVNLVSGCNWLAVVSGVRFLGAFARLRKAAISFIMSVCPHGTTRLPLGGFWWKLIFETFSKICQENSNFVKTNFVEQSPSWEAKMS